MLVYRTWCNVFVGSFFLEGAWRRPNGRHSVYLTDHERTWRSSSDYNQSHNELV